MIDVIAFISVGLYISGIILALALAFMRTAQPRFRLAPICAMGALAFASILPTPNSWSDGRSQWLPELASLPIVAFVGTIGYIALFRGRVVIERLLGGLEVLLFVTFTPLLLANLYRSYLFLTEVRISRELLRQDALR